jgi:formylglycine-generating enzyme required for sulfatase activity
MPMRLRLGVAVMLALALCLLARPAAGAGCPAQMVFVGAGEFIMGSDAIERRLAYARSSAAVREAAWFDAELPRHVVALPAFCIERVLVTQRAYAEFVRATGHRQPEISEADYQRQGFLVHDYAREVARYAWRSDAPPARLANHPVVLVSAADADAYCRWRRSGGRLPTEAEWEKASRGGDGRLFPWGSAWESARLNSAASGTGGTTPVDRYPAGASPHRMLDAAGNVFQWTATALEDGRRILKGCAWDDELALCRPAFRHGRSPGSRHILIGFRCAGPAS